MNFDLSKITQSIFTNSLFTQEICKDINSINLRRINIYS